MSELENNIIGGKSTINFWKESAQKLEKKDTVFRVADFDYTLFSRDEQLSQIPDLAKNRGDKGPQYLFEQYGMNNFLDTFYNNISLPTEILSQLNNTTDIIMTAGGSKDFQIAKVRSCPELDNFQVVLTLDGEEKIPSVIRHVLFELKYIPSEIIVYEDRPQYFVEYRELIEQTLGTKLIIMKVEMNGNDGYKSIKEI